MFFNHKDIKEHIKRLKTGNPRTALYVLIFLIWFCSERQTADPAELTGRMCFLKKKAARTEQLFFYIISFVGQASRFP
jgi:hypothetical protein